MIWCCVYTYYTLKSKVYDRVMIPFTIYGVVTVVDITRCYKKGSAPKPWQV